MCSGVWRCGGMWRYVVVCGGVWRCLVFSSSQSHLNYFSTIISFRKALETLLFKQLVAERF